jgi:hypothetical protein
MGSARLPGRKIERRSSLPPVSESPGDGATKGASATPTLPRLGLGVSSPVGHSQLSLGFQVAQRLQKCRKKRFISPEIALFFFAMVVILFHGRIPLSSFSHSSK